MVGDFAFYAFKDRIQQENFRNIFCFLIITGLWVKPFLILFPDFSKLFSILHSTCTGTFGGKNKFFKIPTTNFLSEAGQKTMSFFYQNFPGTIVKNALFSCRLTHSIKWFSRENFRSRCFNWILRGKTQAELSKKGLQWQKNNWGQRFFTSNGLILDIVMSHRTIFFGIWLKILNRDVNTAFSASRWTTSVKTTFLE